MVGGIGVSRGNEGLERTEGWRRRVWLACERWSGKWDDKLTWDNVPSVHSVLVLDETEAIHEFDFGDFASTMRGKMRLDVSLSSCGRSSVSSNVVDRSLVWGNGRCRPISQSAYHSGANCPGIGGSTTPQSLCMLARRRCG
jgi:hypothetical protein